VSAQEEIAIRADRLGRGYASELWRHRELFFFLAWRDLLVRYKQTVAGIGWSIVRPLLTILILTMVFDKLGNMPSYGAPYPLLVLCGVLPWQFISTALADSGNSLVANTGLISKVYFPRLLIPASTLLTALVDFLICLVLLVCLLFWYRWLPPATVLWLPVFILAACALAFGVGVWISALMVRYRDFRYIVPFIVQFGLYVSPVGFLSSVIPKDYRLLYSLNPAVAIIDGFRWSILGSDFRPDFVSVVSMVGAIVLLVSTGLWYFRKTERTFADVI
jgi:lipopolysaccharide transport system permease protein